MTRLAAATLALLAALAPLGAGAAEIRTLEGTQEAEVRAIAVSGDRVRVLTDQATLDGDAVRTIRFGRRLQPRPPEGSAVVYLRAGGRLIGPLGDPKGEAVAVSSAALGDVEVALDLVRGVALTPDADARARFERDVLPRDPVEDLFVLSSGQTRKGTLEGFTKEGVKAELGDDGAFTLGADRLIGVRLAPLIELPAPAGRRARVRLGTGEEVSGRLLGLEAGKAIIESGFGRLELPVDAIEEIELLGGRFEYLSDLEPANVEARSDVIALVFPPRRDEAVRGGALELGGRSYDKGIGLKAYSRLTYDLGGRYERLRAVIGLDDTTRDRDIEGTVRFQVLVDGKPALGAEGRLLTSRDAPVRIDIPLRGAKTIDLVADFGPSGDVLARGAFADAFLIKR